MNGGANGESKDDTARWDRSVLYFLAQHYNYKLSRDLKKALNYTEKLIELAPKTYDWHMTKARIQKHLGQPEKAAKTMNYARELDLRDRWINSKCAKYQLRNNDNDVALDTMSKFTRNEVIGGTLGDLTEMQALWYLTEDGEAYARQGRFGLALKRFQTVYNIFEQWQEDQFDFHTFSLRKAQIRAYIDMIRWEDKLRSHPYYLRAALDTINVYLILHDNPSIASLSELPKGLDPSQANDSKAVKKAKQEEDRREAELRENDRKAAAKKNNMGQDGEVKKTDDDPKGLKLAQTKTPMEDSMKYLNPLIEFGGNNMQVQKVAVKVFLRRKMLFLALKHLLAAFRIDAKDPGLHPLAIRFCKQLNETSDAPEQLTKLARENLPEPYRGLKDSAKTNEVFLKEHSESVSHACAFLEASRVLLAEKTSDISPIIYALDKQRPVSLEDAEHAILVAKECGASSEEVQKIQNKAGDALGYGEERLRKVVAIVR